MTDKVIGFIGVGLMGHGMAKNIVENGWPLVIMGHRNRAPVEDLVGRGGSGAIGALTDDPGLDPCGVVVGDQGQRYGAEGTGPSIYVNDPEGNVVELKGPPTG